MTLFQLATITWLFILNCWLLLIEDDESNDFDNRIQLVQTMSDVLLRQFLGHVVHIERESLLRTTRDGNLIKKKSRLAFEVLLNEHDVDSTNLFVKACAGDFVKAFLEHRLVVLWMRELEQNSRRRFCEAEAAFEVHFFTNQGSSIHR